VEATARRANHVAVASAEIAVQATTGTWFTRWTVAPAETRD